MRRKSYWIKKISAIALTAALVGTGIPITTVTVEAAQEEIAVEAASVNAGTENYELMSQVQGASILHCWNWSYKTIEEHMELIAECGYTAVQTSPAQQPKDYTYQGNVGNEVGYPGLSGKGNWWKLYQPVTFSVCDNGQTWLGTKAELESMCATAEKYGIKVIVDIVANHMGNITGWQNSMSDISPQVGEYWDPNMLTDQSFWHINDLQIWMSDGREHFTQGTMGMPDLNTANKTVQRYVYEYLDELIDCGVDGFRFDAAKHIETPDDDPAFASDFWPTVLNEARSHYTSKTGGDLFVYGEILNTVGLNFSIDSYTKYMSVTDNSAGNHLLEAFRNNNSGNTVNLNYAADKSVLWAESHDTYMNESSRYASDKSIVRTWALVANKKDASALFFVRPYYSKDTLNNDQDGSERGDLANQLEPAIMGECETYVWASKEVAAINHFNNRMKDYGDNSGSEGNIAYCQRGDGIILVNFDGAGSVSLGSHGLADGSYTDEVSGNTFTVSGGTISGTITSEYGIAVLYKNVKSNPSTVYPVKITSSIEDKSNYYLDTIGLTLTAENADSAVYEASTGETGTFEGSTRINVGKGVAIGDSVTVKVTGTNARGTYEKTFTYYKQDLDIDQCIFFRNSKNWVKANAYVYGEDTAGTVTATLSGWSGVRMFEYEEDADGTMIYAVEIPEIEKYNTVNFNNNVAEIQTSLGRYGQMYDPATGSWTQYLEPGAGKAKVTASLDSTTIVSEKSVTFSVTNADSATYSVNGGAEQPFTDSITLTVGSNLAEGESDTVKIVAVKGDKVTEQTYIYTMGENKPLLNISPGTGTTFTDVLDVELSADNVVEASYQINDGTVQSFSGTKTIVIGEDCEAGDSVEITLYGKSSNGREATVKAVFVKTAESEHYYVFYKNTSGWSNVNAYIWNNSTQENMADWPGTQMTVYDQQDNIYMIDLGTEASYDRIIFSNSGASQSADLVLGSAGQLYDASTGTWSDYYVTNTPTISTTLESGIITESTQVTFTVEDALQATYKVGSSEAVSFEKQVTLTVGEGLADGETQTIVIKALNGDKAAIKVYTYEMKSTVAPSPSITPETSVTPIPTVTEMPESSITPEPTVTEMPESSVTPIPTVTNPPESSVTPIPTVTNPPESSVTTIPTVTNPPESSVTPIPTVTNPPESSATPIPTVTNPPESSVTPVPTVTDIPVRLTATPKPTAAAEPTKGSAITTKPDQEGEIAGTLIPKGDYVLDEKAGALYMVTKSSVKNGTVEYQEPMDGVKGTVKIPAAITVDGITYKVTAIAANAFKNNKKVTKVIIGSNVKTIGKNAFSGCSKLKTVSMGKNVATISDKAFYKCTALTKITIPSKVNKIGKSAFYGCKKLKTITIKTTKLTKKKVGTKAFKGIYSKAAIKVPKSKLKSYKTMLKSKGLGSKVTIKK